jgi:hypothetical protein
VIDVDPADDSAPIPGFGVERHREMAGPVCAFGCSCARALEGIGVARTDGNVTRSGVTEQAAGGVGTERARVRPRQLDHESLANGYRLAISPGPFAGLNTITVDGALARDTDQPVP